MEIKINNLSCSYGNDRILQDISFSVKKGEFLSILGANGVGKSTLFRCMLGFVKPDAGQILIGGIERAELSERELAKRIAYIPQSSSPAFHFSVFDIVLMGLTSRMKPLAVPGNVEKACVMQALEKVGIQTLASRCFHKLSGGEKQLVMLARALVQNAPVLMLDEPTASLDLGNRLKVLRQMRALADEGYTVIQTTHDPDLCYLFSDRILALKDGKILKDGEPKEVMTEEIMKKMYGTEISVVSLMGDRSRVCLPAEL